jgi:hypothetical protein
MCCKRFHANSPSDQFAFSIQPVSNTVTCGEELVNPIPNLQAGDSPFVGCLRLLVQYIRSYPPTVQTHTNKY